MFLLHFHGLDLTLLLKLLRCPDILKDIEVPLVIVQLLVGEVNDVCADLQRPNAFE